MRRLNVLYVIPRYETYGMAGHYVMPVGILCVSAYVKRAAIAHIFTLNLNHQEGEERELLRACITRHKIDIFCVGGLSGEYHDIARMVQWARHIKQEIIIVAGGGIITAHPQAAMQALPEVDYGIVGEGEITSVELIEALTRGSSVATIEGLIYRSESALITTPARKEIENLDTLPLPDYEGFQYGAYLKENPDLSDEGKKYSQVSVIGGRSCKYNCTFCFHPSGTTYRQRSLDSIFTEIDYLTAHYKISYIALREELFATDNQRVAQFCERIKRYDLDWSIQLRIDSINPRLIELLKGSRCRYIFVGVESASDTVLRSMHKGIGLKEIEEALELLGEAGLHSRSGIIFGDSAETLETALFSLDWYKAHCTRYRLFVDMIIAFPGSILYRRACRQGIIPNPVRFLQEGCPIVNVSQMDNTQFDYLVHQIEETNHRQYNIQHYERQE